jgi:hypothetical protein
MKRIKVLQRQMPLYSSIRTSGVAILGLAAIATMITGITGCNPNTPPEPRVNPDTSKQEQQQPGTAASPGVNPQGSGSTQNQQ